MAGPWRQDFIDAEAEFVVGVAQPFGGALLIGEESISYFSDRKPITISPAGFGEHQSPVIGELLWRCSHEYETIPFICFSFEQKQCWGRIDSTRYMVGDMFGRLGVIVLELDAEQANVVGINHQYIGQTSIPRTLTYLDNSVVHVGSDFGDSQLVRLNSDPREEDGSYLTVLETFAQLGPIVDMCVVDLENQGQGQLVTCSGYGKDGSLRVIRNGVGIYEHANMDLTGVKGVWALKTEPPPSQENLNKDSKMVEPADDVLVVSFVDETRILKFTNADNIEEIELDGVDGTQPTFICSNVGNDDGGMVVQVTPGGVRLIDVRQGLKDSWSPGRNLSVATCNSSQVLCAVGAQLYLLDIDTENGKLNLIKERQLSNEIACLDITPLSASGENELVRSATVCAVGLWVDVSVELLTVPGLDVVHRQGLGGDVIPRSVLLAQLDGTPYLMVAIGDGTVFHFVIESDMSLSQRKSVQFGTQPTRLSILRTRNSCSVFACSDRPTVLYSSNKKLVYSNVNLKEVTCMCRMNTSAYPDSLALAQRNTLIIGSIDDIQKLHIRTVPLGETPRRIAYQPETQTLAVITIRLDVRKDTDGFVVLLPFHGIGADGSGGHGCGTPKGLWIELFLRVGV